MQNVFDAQGLLQELSASPDPRRQLLARLLEQRADADRRQAAQRTRAREREQRMLQFLALQNAELAAACGACPCWGQPRCTTCRGQGGAGWRAPDPDRFTRFIEPVLHRLGLLVNSEHAEAAANVTSPREG